MKLSYFRLLRVGDLIYDPRTKLRYQICARHQTSRSAHRLEALLLETTRPYEPETLRPLQEGQTGLHLRGYDAHRIEWGG
jgi:hypothetical protein